MNHSDIRIGTAGWSIARDMGESFPAAGSHLERYSRHFNCAEINSTFYRLPRASTLVRWASSTPDDFRFSVKMPKAITHEGALQPERGKLGAFMEQARILAEKLGPILVQLPPKRIFDPTIARSFLALLRDLHPDGPVVLEPRHASWFTSEAQSVLQAFTIGRVVADPTPPSGESTPGGHLLLNYYRLHGSPRVYYSSYSDEHLHNLSLSIRAAASTAQQWVIFDNTASGAAIRNAFDLDLLVRTRNSSVS